MPKVGRRHTRGNPEKEKEREAGDGGAQGEKMPKAGGRRTRAILDMETEREAKKRSLPEVEASPGAPHGRASAVFAAFEHGYAPQSEDRVYDVVEFMTEEFPGPPIPLLHQPYIPDELASHPGIHHTFELAEANYNAEEDCRYALFTMARGPPHSCLFNERRLLPIRENAKNAVLLASGSVVRLSSSLGRVPLNKCCGLWFQHNK